jgi:hypothetical protein
MEIVSRSIQQGAREAMTAKIDLTGFTPQQCQIIGVLAECQPNEVRGAG